MALDIKGIKRVFKLKTQRWYWKTRTAECH